MPNVPARVLISILLLASVNQAESSDAPSAIAEAAKAGRFLCLVFYEETDASLAAMSSSVAAFAKTSAEKISVSSARASDPANKELVSRYGIRGSDLPIVIVVAPNGVVTGGSPKSVTAEQLQQFTSVSGLMLKVIKPMQEQKVALVALQNQSTRFNAESWQAVSEFVGDASYKALVTAIKADPAAPESQEFVKQCQLVGPVTEATVVVLLPPGRIGKVLTGKTTKAEILKSLQACTAGSGCCSDRRFKQNIQPIASALGTVEKLQGVTFTWDRAAFPRRFFPEGVQVGLIAQDVEAAVPEVVAADAEGYKTVAYDKLAAVLIEAVKELSRTVDAQDSLIRAQDARLRALEGR